MKHITALITKFILITLALLITLGYLTELTLLEILYISVVTTILAYLIGDLLILDNTNNTIAIIADVGLAFVTILVMSNLFNRYAIYNDISNNAVSTMDALIAALFIGLGEFVFHKYFNKWVFPDKVQ